MPEIKATEPAPPTPFGAVASLLIDTSDREDFSRSVAMRMAEGFVPAGGVAVCERTYGEHGGQRTQTWFTLLMTKKG